MADSMRNESGIGKQAEHCVFRVIDYMPGDVQSIPLCPKHPELPAVNVRHLKDYRAIVSENPRDFLENLARIRHVLHHVKQSDDIKRPAGERSLLQRSHDDINAILNLRHLCSFRGEINAQHTEPSPLHESKKGRATASDIEQVQVRP